MFQRLKPWNCEHISSQIIFSVNPGAHILSVLYAHNHIQDAFHDAQSVRIHVKTSTNTTDREWPNICVSINSMQSKVRVKCGEESFKDDREKHLFLTHFYLSQSEKVKKTSRPFIFSKATSPTMHGSRKMHPPIIPCKAQKAGVQADGQKVTLQSETSSEA